jgi:hypothetical protein
MMTLSTTVLVDGKTVCFSRVCPNLSTDHRVEVQVGAETPRLFNCPDRDGCYEASQVVSEAIWGRSARFGGIDATNSMVWSITNLIEQIAGC